MKIKLLLSLAILAAGQVAGAADFTIVTQVLAVEMSPSNMILPATTNGMLTYKPCADECDAEYERARITADTRFSISGKAAKFVDFQAEFAAIKNAEKSYALLSVEKATRTVTSIDIAR